MGRMSCMVEALLNFSLRIGFLMEPLRINEIGQQEIVYNLFLFRCIHPHSSTSLLMRTSCSSVGAFLWDFTIALVLHTCDARSNGPKKRSGSLLSRPITLEVVQTAQGVRFLGNCGNYLMITQLTLALRLCMERNMTDTSLLLNSAVSGLHSLLWMGLREEGLPSIATTVAKAASLNRGCMDFFSACYSLFSMGAESIPMANLRRRNAAL